MKKLVSLLLVAMLAFACVSFAAAEDITGTWYLTSMTQGDTTIDPATIGVEITMTLNADGTASMDALGQASAGTWSMDGANVTVVADDVPQAFIYDGASLKADMDGMSMTFERTGGDIFTRPEEIYAEDISQFDGDWTAYKAGALGAYMDIEAISSFISDSDSVNMSITLKNGAMTVDGSDTLQFDLADGLLFMEAPDANGENSSMRIHLLEGDLIELDTNLGFSIIFARAGEQAA